MTAVKIIFEKFISHVAYRLHTSPLYVIKLLGILRKKVQSPLKTIHKQGRYDHLNVYGRQLSKISFYKSFQEYFGTLHGIFQHEYSNLHIFSHILFDPIRR